MLNENLLSKIFVKYNRWFQLKLQEPQEQPQQNNNNNSSLWPSAAGNNELYLVDLKEINTLVYQKNKLLF